MQRVFDLQFRFHRYGEFQNEELNELLSEGFEIKDIEAYYKYGGGAIFTTTAGIYAEGVLVTLFPSEKKSLIKYHIVKPEKNGTNIINEVISREFEDGFNLHKVLSINAILDPVAERGIGRGTIGFALFFIKNI